MDESMLTATPRRNPWALAALVVALTGLATALLAVPVASLISGVPTGASGYPLSSAAVADTEAYRVLSLAFIALGTLALILATAAFAHGPIGRIGRAAIAIGIVVAAWHYVLMALFVAAVIVVVLHLLAYS